MTEEQNNFNIVLQSFSINAECTGHKKIRNISLYDMNFKPGARIKDVSKYLDEISVALKARSKPMVKILPQEGIVRLEVIDDESTSISFVDEFTNLKKQDGLIPIYLGNSVSGDDIIFDLAQNPHCIVGGATGSGKSTLLHTMIGNILSFNDVQTYIIDPKSIEFIDYDKKAIVYNTYDQAVFCLKALHQEMEERYSCISGKLCSADYFLSNQTDHKKIVLIIDEFADLIMQDEHRILYDLICKLSSKSRAAGIFIILATQRPDVKVISGQIKANFPARISCATASGYDSKVILDTVGAENLAGRGDAIIKNYKYNYQRFQTAYSTSKEVMELYN